MIPSQVAFHQNIPTYGILYIVMRGASGTEKGAPEEYLSKRWQNKGKTASELKIDLLELLYSVLISSRQTDTRLRTRELKASLRTWQSEAANLRTGQSETSLVLLLGHPVRSAERR